MTTLDIYEREYVDYSLRTMGESKYSWAASYIKAKIEELQKDEG